VIIPIYFLTWHQGLNGLIGGLLSEFSGSKGGHFPTPLGRNGRARSNPPSGSGNKSMLARVSAGYESPLSLTVHLAHAVMKEDKRLPGNVHKLTMHLILPLISTYLIY